MNKLSPKKSLASTILVNCLVPYALYTVLSNYTSNITALSASVCIPLVENIYQILKRKTIDPLGIFILFGTILGILAALIGGNEKLFLIRESIVTSIIGICFLISLLFSKPLILIFAKSFINDEERYRRVSQNKYQHVFRSVTLVWGLVLISEALIKVYLVYHLYTSTFLLVSPIFSYCTVGITAAWTFCIFRTFKKNQVNQ